MPEDAHDAAAQMVSRGTSLRAAQDVEMLLVEWHLSPDGRGRPLAPKACEMVSTTQWGSPCLEGIISFSAAMANEDTGSSIDIRP